MSRPIFELSTPFSLFNGAVVLACTETQLTFGLLHTDDDALKERLQKAADAFFGEAGGTCAFEAISREAFERAVSRQYGKHGDVTPCAAPDETPAESEMHAAVLLLDSLLGDARRRGATDIHIEENRVRFRVSGVLETVCDLAAPRSRELVRRIKMLARLDVLASHVAQDGQFVVMRTPATLAEPLRADAKDAPLFVRVSCVPALSADGDGAAESVVLRLLDGARVPLDSAALGFSPAQVAALSDCTRLENGLVLLCGATGSGKSTTAAALLTDISRSCARKIITIEEPPEYVLKGVTQIAVRARTGMDFAHALTAVFRQDPDVIFIGEIRDAETAQVALQAAMTGHLVFATLHTGGFFETLLRLRQLGADMRHVSAVLRFVIVQRLVHTDGAVHLQAGVLRVQDDMARLLDTFDDRADGGEAVQSRIKEMII